MLKFVNTGVVFQEVPDETTLAVNISNCPCHCPGCHSSFLWEDIGTELTSEVIDAFVDKFGFAITCIAFMGGDSDPSEVNRLARYVHDNYKDIKVAWYSGRQKLAEEIETCNFDYIKLGPYISEKGPLKSPTTNQRMYKKVGDDFEDITYRFQRK